MSKLLSNVKVGDIIYRINMDKNPNELVIGKIKAIHNNGCNLFYVACEHFTKSKRLITLVPIIDSSYAHYIDSHYFTSLEELKEYLPKLDVDITHILDQLYKYERNQ